MDQSDLVSFLAFVLLECFDALHEICGILVQVLVDEYSLSSRKIAQPAAKPRKQAFLE